MARKKTNLQSQPNPSGAIVPGVDLVSLGLSESDLPQIQKLAESLQERSADSVFSFGQQVAEHTAQYTESFLKNAHNQDLAVAGKKLGEVVQLARATRVRSLESPARRIPVVGPLVAPLVLRFGRFQSRFESTEKQMQGLMGDVAVIRERLAEQNRHYEQAFEATKEECRLLGLHVAAGRLKLQELGQRADALRAGPQDPFTVQELADLEAQIHRLDIRVASLLSIQQSALQTLPQIRVVQASNAVLIEKFHTINEVTLPAWRRQMALRLGLNEQRNAIQVADAVDRATNEFLVENAKLLHSNAVSAATANQRLAIDPATLQKVQDELLRTLQDVLQVQSEGQAARRQAEKQILEMRKTFEKQIGSVTRSRAALDELPAPSFESRTAYLPADTPAASRRASL
jgi:uncharacterized protein YaaN involved in tellurite resistance